MAVAIIILSVIDKPKLKIVEDLREAKPIYDKYVNRGVNSIHVIDLDNNRVFDNERDLRDCPYTFSHTRHWCGHDICRDS